MAGLRVKGEDGEVRSGAERLKRWEGYFRSLLRGGETSCGRMVDGFGDGPYVCRDNPPDLVEMSSALRAVKFGKAAGPDGVSAELLKGGGVWVKDWLVR